MQTFVIAWIAVCSTIAVLIAIVAALNAVFAIRMRGKILGDRSFGGGDGGTTKPAAVNSHFGGVLDGGASLECGGDMVGACNFGGGGCSISGPDGGQLTGCGDSGGGGGSVACGIGNAGGGCGC